MKLACCVWIFSQSETDILNQMKALGFDWIDIQPHMLQSDMIREQAIQKGLQVSCVGASFGIPEDAGLDHMDKDKRQIAIDHVIETVTHASKLGAGCVYVIPGLDTSSDAMQYYADSLSTVADYASQHNIKIGIEHFPGRALPTAQATLDFIEETGHPNLHLLLDSGHLQMSDEDAGDIIRQAGKHLAYVHLDDNDGEGDLHWALLDGVMTRESLTDLFSALDDIGYSGAISLELSPKLEQPIHALQTSRQLVLDIMSEG